MDRSTELIERYLDDLATAAERAELAALLAADPAVADALARATRVDALIARRFGGAAVPRLPDGAPAPPVPPAVAAGRSAWKWVAAALALLVVVAAGLGGAGYLLLSALGPGEAPHTASGPGPADGTSHTERAPDLVGQVEGVSTTRQQQVINGVESTLAETRLSVVVRGGASAEVGSRRTVRLTDRTRRADPALPALGDVVRVWLVPGSADVADYVAIDFKGNR